MSKKNQQNKKSALITEEEKTSNPIFNAIYKKIRNLNKKLANIELLEKQPLQTLKQEQIVKIERKIDTVNEIKKNQEFALFYKSILEQNDGVAFDTSDLLIKVATLLAVGQHAQKTNNIPKDFKNVYNNTYQNLVEQKDPNVSISDRVVNIFNILNDFVKSDKNYQACRNYISFLPEQKPASQILQVQSKIEEVPQAKVQKISTLQVQQKSKHSPISEPVLQKPVNKIEQAPTKVVQQPVKVEPVQSKPENVKKSWLDDFGDDQQQNVNPIEKTETQKKSEPLKNSIENKQQINQTLKQSSTNQGDKQVGQIKKTTQYQSRNTNNYRRGNNQKRGGYNNYHHQNSRPYQNHNKFEQEQYHKPRNDYYQNQKFVDKKNNQPKKTRDNRDNDSDTSLQPTPEKLQKKQFVKYVEKR